MGINPLAGTWKLSSYNYILPNGHIDEDVQITNAMRVYNDSHFSVYYEYENEGTETCISAYKLDGNNIEVTVLCHSIPGYTGHTLKGHTYIENKHLFHQMSIDGYMIEEVYERLN